MLVIGCQQPKSLEDAVMENKPKIVQEFIRKGADVNASNKDGNTVLMLASQKGYDEVVKVLLGAGANVNAFTKEGFTALMAARFLEHADVVKILREAGAN